MKVLVGVDLAKAEPEVIVDQGAEFAAAFGARADLLFVGDHDDGRLAAELARLPESVRGEARVRSGDPVTTLVEEATAYDALVVGPRAPGALERLLLGTIAARVIRRTRTAVYVPRTSWPSGGGPVKAVLGVDLRRETADNVFREAAPWVQRLGARLDLVFVDDLRLPRIREPKVLAAALRERDQLREPKRRRLEEILARLPEANRGEAVVDGGDPGSHLVGLSTSADLVIVGAFERMGIAQHLLGSVAEYVVSHASCGVLALPAAPLEA